MFRTLTCALAFLVASATLAAPGRVFDAADFASNRVPRCTETAGKLEPITLEVQISPKLAPYQFRLISEPMAAPDGEVHAIGRIEISEAGSNKLLQTIPARSIWNDGLCRHFDATDVNFDGYLDISFVRDGGAKWGSCEYFLFDPHSGRFVSNRVTRALGQLRHNGIQTDSQAQHLRVAFMGPGMCPGGTNVYAIRNGALVGIHEEEGTWKDGGCIRQVQERVNGAWKMVSTRKEQQLNDPGAK